MGIWGRLSEKYKRIVINDRTYFVSFRSRYREVSYYDVSTILNGVEVFYEFQHPDNGEISCSYGSTLEPKHQGLLSEVEMAAAVQEFLKIEHQEYLEWRKRPENAFLFEGKED